MINDVSIRRACLVGLLALLPVGCGGRGEITPSQLCCHVSKLTKCDGRGQVTAGEREARAWIENAFDRIKGSAGYATRWSHDFRYACYRVAKTGNRLECGTTKFRHRSGKGLLPQWRPFSSSANTSSGGQKPVLFAGFGHRYHYLDSAGGFAYPGDKVVLTFREGAVSAQAHEHLADTKYRTLHTFDGLTYTPRARGLLIFNTPGWTDRPKLKGSKENCDDEEPGTAGRDAIGELGIRFRSESKATTGPRGLPAAYVTQEVARYILLPLTRKTVLRALVAPRRFRRFTKTVNAKAAKDTSFKKAIEAAGWKRLQDGLKKFHAPAKEAWVRAVDLRATIVKSTFQNIDGVLDYRSTVGRLVDSLRKLRQSVGLGRIVYADAANELMPSLTKLHTEFLKKLTGKPQALLKGNFDPVETSMSELANQHKLTNLPGREWAALMKLPSFAAIVDSRGFRLLYESYHRDPDKLMRAEAVDKRTVLAETNAVRPEGNNSRNVVFEVKGRNSKLRPLLVSAHYDHLGRGWECWLGFMVSAQERGRVHMGADDNASGVACLLELAEWYVRNRPKRTVVFVAFCAEEVGLVGSSRYVSDVAASRPPLAVVNLDMVGMLNPIEVYGVPESAKRIKAAVLKAAEESRFPAKFVRVHDGGYRSDHVPFLGQKDVCAAVSITTGGGRHYHSPRDVRVNAGSMYAASVFARHLVDRFASLTSSDCPKTKGPPNIVVPHLGTAGAPIICQSYGGGGGAVVARERGKLRRGDLIVQLGQIPVFNLEQLTVASSESARAIPARATPADEGPPLVSLTVVRTDQGGGTRVFSVDVPISGVGPPPHDGR